MAGFGETLLFGLGSRGTFLPGPGMRTRRRAPVYTTNMSPILPVWVSGSMRTLGGAAAWRPSAFRIGDIWASAVSFRHTFRDLRERNPRGPAPPGPASYKKVLLNHGTPDSCYGVKISELKVFQKRIKRDYRLSLDLTTPASTTRSTWPASSPMTRK